MIKWDELITEGERELHALSEIERAALARLEALQRAARSFGGRLPPTLSRRLRAAEEAYAAAVDDRECQFGTVGATILAKYEQRRN